MSLGHGASIVRSGLVLSLDAANVKSYPGSGTTWSDLSGRGNNGTLTNGPTYNSTNGGSIVFDGTNDHASLTTAITAEAPSFSGFAWIYRADSTTTDVILGDNTGKYAGLLLTTDGRLSLLTQAGGTFQIQSAASLISNATWYQIGVTRGATDILYINGQQVGSGTITQGRTFTFNVIGQSSSSDYFIGRIAATNIYNRALTQAEVIQNFNALRGRYGI
jgi:hypothetical protein